jgi:hypothetical protein
MNMNEIENILQEMGCETLPLKIRIGNRYSDTVWVEYDYNPTLGKYQRITIDDEDLQPRRKK